MYNMGISILGYKFSVEILILIGVIYLILVGHTFCGCCNVGLIEGLDMMKSKTHPKRKVVAAKATELPTQTAVGDSDDISITTEEPVVHTTEGFTGANIKYGESSLYDLNNDTLDTSAWSAPDMSVASRPPQPIPLPEGEMLLFANTPFKPECCPNSYSTSSGYACMTNNQYNYLAMRASNNTPYSAY